jgi:putative endonuclease
MAVQQEVGDKGEEIALQYLMTKGYKILDAKWHYGHLELDIVAMEGQELVIVEVKSRSGLPYEFPADALSEKKIKMIVEAADAYIQLHDLACETRFDLVTVIFHGENYELEHFKEAFYPTL